MKEELGQYIMNELGDDVYEELFIDPEDYNTLPAYEFYEELITACKLEHPEIIEKYNKIKEEEYYAGLPKENIQKSTVETDFNLACEITEDILIHTSKYRLQKPDYGVCRSIYTPFLNMIKTRSPMDLKKFLLDNAKGNIPKSTINCKKFYNQIVYLARKYRNQYK